MKILTMKEALYMLINGQIYKSGQDDILCWCVLPHECQLIINEAHVGATTGHFEVDTIVKKILQAGLRWPTLTKYFKTQLLKCDKFQRMGRPLKQNEIPLIFVNLILTFEI